MNARTLPDGALVVSHGDWLHLASALGFVALALWAFLDPTPEPRQQLAGAVYVGFALLLALTYERVEFRFSHEAGRVEWRRARLWRRHAGAVPLADVEAVALESSLTGRPPYTRRLALVTRAGRVPLTTAYHGNAERLAAVGEAIQRAFRPRGELAFYR
jgi:hypothetical protein